VNNTPQTKYVKKEVDIDAVQLIVNDDEKSQPSTTRSSVVATWARVHKQGARVT
jgi:hypothetical protein